MFLLRVPFALHTSERTNHPVLSTTAASHAPSVSRYGVKQGSVTNQRPASIVLLTPPPFLQCKTKQTMTYGIGTGNVLLQSFRPGSYVGRWSSLWGNYLALRYRLKFYAATLEKIVTKPGAFVNCQTNPDNDVRIPATTHSETLYHRYRFFTYGNAKAETKRVLT